MHKPFYASGFLYSLKTHQILLLHSERKDDIAPFWSTLAGIGEQGEETNVAFQRIINKLLKLNLKTKDIYPIYDYPQDTEDTINHVFYAQVKGTQEFEPPLDGTYSWVTFSELTKMLFAPHKAQDVIVGERVINLMLRLGHEQNQ